jgi:site-specific DNA-methyltransferase (adenine-specific)
VGQNLAAHSVGALNIDDSRVPLSEGDDPRLGGNGTWSSDKMAKNVYEGGYAGVRVGSSPLGRWPANVIHDGSDEVLQAFPSAPGQLADASTSSSRKTQNVYGDMKRGNGRDGEASADSDNEGAVGFKMKPGARRADSGSAARFFYCAKAAKADRDDGLDGFEAVHRPNGNKWTDQDYRVANGERPLSAESGPRKNVHPTVKPTELMRYLCRLITPPGGTVLDPFMGSGSTGRGAVLEGFNFIGIELDAQYAAIAQARIAAAATSTMTTDILG